MNRSRGRGRAASAELRTDAPAPAKINLGLRIVARRADGYHELESVFAPLDLADQLGLRVEESAQPRVRLTLEAQDRAVPAGPENLVVRAAQAFLDASGLALSIEITLTKRIPVGGGLGGGSSDAGTALRLLAEAWPGALPAPRLSEIARSIGSDVSYFLSPRPARVAGVGERITPLPGLPALSLLLVNPGVVLPTAEVYRAFDALVPDPAARSQQPARIPLRLSDAAPGLALDNDLEAAALRLCPQLRRLRQRLEATGPLATGMSGSGPTLFGVFASESEAAQAAREDFGPGVWTRVAATRESG